MQSALDSFHENMGRVHVLHALHGTFAAQITAALNLDDMLRAEVVLALSALDHYVHELARLGMLECWMGVRPATDAFGKFQLPISCTAALGNPATATSAVDQQIRLKHSYSTFQHPDRIAEAVRLFKAVDLWEEVAARLGSTKRDVKSSLTLIVERRNKIAHEADIDPSFPGQHWPIGRPMVEDMLRKIERIVEAIHDVCGSSTP